MPCLSGYEAPPPLFGSPPPPLQTQPPPPPPAVKMVREWEGVGVWPVATAPLCCEDSFLGPDFESSANDSMSNYVTLAESQLIGTRLIAKKTRIYCKKNYTARQIFCTRFTFFTYLTPCPQVDNP